jgi:hypothetical protein
MSKNITIKYSARNDYYEGEYAEIWKNGEMIWNGYSCNNVTQILDALGIEYDIEGYTYVQTLMQP